MDENTRVLKKSIFFIRTEMREYNDEIFENIPSKTERASIHAENDTTVRK